ncbi:MAG: class I SAM-dependent methyltransferase [Chloroflexota bacterium]|nr:MAG: class I SAM-dependent methyltransferase [Chloroflexota bacterium]
MDTWKFYDITHRDHIVCNPTSVAKLDELIGLLDLPAEPRVLDIACGKGELLLRLAERWGRGPGGAAFRGVGVDVSPYHIAELRGAAARRAPDAELELLEMGGADYPATPASFDLTCCVGASWIFDGHAGTLRALRDATRPGGEVLVGEPFWQRQPDPAYLDSAGLRRAGFGSHAGNVAAGVEAGLTPLLALVSNGDEWDRYETLQWRSAARYAATNPDDPDVPELLARIERGRHEYLTWGRETLGWALYLFRTPAAVLSES